MTAFFFNHVWQSTLFAGVIAALALALRHNRARRRYGLWVAASVKVRVPGAALAEGPRSLAPSGKLALWPILPVCMSCRKMRPPAAWTASVTRLQPATCAA